jgi:hypothetical protein
MGRTHHDTSTLSTRLRHRFRRLGCPLLGLSDDWIHWTREMLVRFDLAAGRSSSLKKFPTSSVSACCLLANKNVVT